MPILQEKKRKKHNPLRVVTNLLRTPLLFSFPSLSLSLSIMLSRCAVKPASTNKTQWQQKTHQKQNHTHTQTETNTSGSVCLTISRKQLAPEASARKHRPPPAPIAHSFLKQAAISE